MGDVSRLRIALPSGVEIFGRPPLTGARPGLYLGPGGWSGWDAGVTAAGEQVGRPAQHGDFDLPVYLGSRAVTATGIALARTPFELGRLRSQINGVGADGAAFPIAVEHQDETLTATARRIDSGFTDQGRSHGWFTAAWSLDLVCRDPRKYGPEQTFTGATVSVHHRGNFPSLPAVEVAGPRSGYTVSGPGGRRIVVSQSLSAGQRHLIDFASGGLYRNGARQLGAVDVWEPWAIPPGTTVGMTCTGGTMTVRVPDTYH